MAALERRPVCLVGEVAAEDLVGYLQVALIRDLLDVAAEDGLVHFSGHVCLLLPEPPPLGLWHHHGASRTSSSHLVEGLFTQVLRR
jgi:hypothetical protein